MEERSTFDILIEYPRKHGLAFDTHRDYRRFYYVPDDSILNTKFVIFKIRSLYFYAYDLYAEKAYMTKTFTGLYSLISDQEDTELKIYKKDFADSFLRVNKKKTGFKFVDDNLTITSTNKELSIFLSKEAAMLFLEIDKMFNSFHLLIQNDYLQNITELRGKKVIGLETQQWLYKEEDIDSFISLGEKLIESIINVNA